MKILNRALVASIGLVAAQSASAALVGWQTFGTYPAPANANLTDSTPDNNTTWDATPVGSSVPAGGGGSVYLSGVIGTGASSLGRDGWGTQTNSGFLNGPGFGNEGANSSRLIVNNTMSDGTAGTRIGPNGCGTANCGSSWKFGNSGNQRIGDVQITNESDYVFRLEFIHFDARVGNSNSPDNLQIVYLNGNGTAFDNELRRFDNGNEIGNLTSVYNVDYDPTNSAGSVTNNVSRSLGAATSTQVYLEAGQSAAFRFLWTGQVTEGAQSQIDNLAFEGSFFETSALATMVDPAAVSAVPLPAAGWMFLTALGGLFARKQVRK